MEPEGSEDSGGAARTQVEEDTGSKGEVRHERHKDRPSGGARVRRGTVHEGCRRQRLSWTSPSGIGVHNCGHRARGDGQGLQGPAGQVHTHLRHGLAVRVVHQARRGDVQDMPRQADQEHLPEQRVRGDRERAQDREERTPRRSGSCPTGQRSTEGPSWTYR